MILNLHTHLPAPKPEAIISCNPWELPDENAFPGQYYSVGVHPWVLPATGLTEEDIQKLREYGSRPDVAAIGEAGIDLMHDGCAPLFAQMLALKSHIEISEELEKPLILHCVKGHDRIISLRKTIQPKQHWIIHCFRGKPSILRMLLEAGIDVSYGEYFNPESVALTPTDRLFAETDESLLSITEIIARLSAVNPLITQDSIAGSVAAILDYS